MNNIEAAINAARIGSEIEDTSNLEVFTEAAAAAGQAMADLENQDGFEWGNQTEDWETTCAAVADHIANLAPGTPATDWAKWLAEYLSDEPAFVPDNAKTLAHLNAYYDAAAPLYQFLEADAIPDGYAAKVRKLMAELYGPLNEFRVYVGDEVRKATRDAKSDLIARLIARLTAAGVPAWRVINIIKAIDADVAGVVDRMKAAAQQPGVSREAIERVLGIVRARQATAPCVLTREQAESLHTWMGTAGQKLDEKLQATAAPNAQRPEPEAPNPKEAAVKDTAKGRTIKLSGKLAEAWLNDPANKAIVDQYLQKQQQAQS